MRDRTGYIAAILLIASASSAQAQVTVPDEYGKQIKYSSAVGTLSDDLAGDHIDLSSGRLEIIQTDIDLPGNNALPVRVGRRFQPADYYNQGHFGLWTMEIPNVHGTFAKQVSHWTVVSTGGSSVYNRCSNFDVPPDVLSQYSWWSPSEYWHGNFLYMPGSGDRELLWASGHVPADGKAYPLTTKEGDAVRCVPLAATSASGSQGEGFEVVTSAGMVYTLNQMVVRNQSTLKKSTYGPVFSRATASKPAPVPDPTPNAAAEPFIQREEVILFPTKVADRFGNTVNYTWSATNPWQLLQIVASDGRHLDFTYVAADSDRVAAVSDGTRTWTYSYGNADDVTTLTLPDGGVWTYRLRNLHGMSINALGAHCGTLGGASARTTYTSGNGTNSGSITAPSGATVTYSLSKLMLGRSYASYECQSETGNIEDAYPRNPYLFTTAGVISKTITGPGIPTSGLTWNYSYGPTNNCWDGPSWAEGVQCTTSSAITRLVNVTDPNGNVTLYTFGNRFNIDEGLLLKTDYGWNGTTAQRTTAITYAAADAAPYAPYGGGSIRLNGDLEITSHIRPQRQITTTQQGRTFTWKVETGCSGFPYCFDAFGRPIKVTKSSSP